MNYRTSLTLDDVFAAVNLKDAAERALTLAIGLWWNAEPHAYAGPLMASDAAVQLLALEAFAPL